MCHYWTKIEVGSSTPHMGLVLLSSTDEPSAYSIRCPSQRADHDTFTGISTSDFAAKAASMSIRLSWSACIDIEDLNITLSQRPHCCPIVAATTSMLYCMQLVKAAKSAFCYDKQLTPSWYLTPARKQSRPESMSHPVKECIKMSTASCST